MRLIILQVILFFSASAIGQTQKEDIELYNVINTIFKESPNEVDLNKHFSSYKGWINFLRDTEFFDSLYGNCLDAKEKKVLSANEVLREELFITAFESVSKFSFKENIEADKLNKNIKLTRNTKSATLITKPVIIEKLAIVYIFRNNEESMVILKKVKKNWEIICQKYLFLKTDD